MAIFSFLRGKHVGAIGVDVAADGVKAVQLYGKAGQQDAKVVAWAYQPLPAGAVHAGEIGEPVAFIAALQRLFTKPNFGSFSGRLLVFALPEHQSFHYAFASRKIGNILPKNVIAEEQLRKSVPFKMPDLRWDWQIMADHKTRYHFSTVAAQQSVINGYLNAFKSAGKTPLVIEPQVIASQRFYFESDTLSEPVLSVDIGALETSVATIDSYGVHQSSVIPVGLATWSFDLSKKLKIEFSDARKLVLAGGGGNPDQKKIFEGLLEQGMKQIVLECQQHMSYDRSLHQTQPLPFKRFALGGQGSIVPTVANSLSVSLGLSLMPAQSWLKLVPPFTVAQLLLFHNAIGAAIRGLSGGDAVDQGLNVLYRRVDLPKKKK